MAVAAGVMVMVFEDVAFAQGELPIAVKVKVTLPVAISLGPGAYNSPVRLVPSLKFPSPNVCHCTPVLFETEAPAVMSIGEFEHMVTGVPALAVGCAFTITEYVAVATAQGLLETVIVKVTVFPASPAAAVYVGVNVIALVNDPVPLCVHNIVPLEELAPLTVAIPF